MVTCKILNARKIEENKTESRNIGFEADILIIFKFSYNFFFTTSLSVHSEQGTDFVSLLYAKQILIRSF